MGTLGGTDLGYISSERHKISAPKIALPETDATSGGTPSADTKKTYLNTLMKPVRRITVTGTIFGDISTLQSFISAIEGKAGTDSSNDTFSFSSDTTGNSYDVLVEDFDWEFEAGEPEQLQYSMVLVEGNTT